MQKPQGSGREAFLKRRAGVVEKEECIAQPEDSKTFSTSKLPDSDADTGRLRNAFCLPQLRLSDDLMVRRDIDLELLEFLTAPASVQMMDPESGSKHGRLHAAKMIGGCTCRRTRKEASGPTVNFVHNGLSRAT